MLVGGFDWHVARDIWKGVSAVGSRELRPPQLGLETIAVHQRTVTFLRVLSGASTRSVISKKSGIVSKG